MFENLVNKFSSLNDNKDKDNILTDNPMNETPIGTKNDITIEKPSDQKNVISVIIMMKY